MSMRCTPITLTFFSDVYRWWRWYWWWRWWCWGRRRRRIVTDSSDIVHSQPVPLVLPHPGLPGNIILTLRRFFKKQIWWSLTDELWASCSWAPCCGWTARSWLACPSTGIQPAIFIFYIFYIFTYYIFIYFIYLGLHALVPEFSLR